MRQFYFVLALLASLSISAQEVILTGIVDGTISGQPKAIELFVSGTVDLSNYRLERYSNAGTTPTNIALSGTYTDEFVYAINSSGDDDFTEAFGTDGDFAPSNRILSGSVSGNGNDAFTLVLIATGEVIDQTGGEIGNSSNVYQDSYLIRKSNTGPDGGWVAANWDNFDNNNVLDGLSIAEIGQAVPFGTYTTTPPPPTVSVMAGDNLQEPATDGGFTLELNEAPLTDLTITYTLGGTATVDVDYTDESNGSIIVLAGETSVSLPFSIIDDTESELRETIIVTLSGTSDLSFELGAPATIEVVDNEPVGVRLISEVQGAGLASPLVGQVVAVQGIVVGDFQGAGADGLGGFFIQEEDADNDADPLTSEGIWVRDDNSVEVAEGDLVTVTGTAAEFFGLTQVDATVDEGIILVLSTGNSLPAFTTLTLPLTNEEAYEAFEGMRVELAGPVSVTSTQNLGEFGEFEVSSGERLIQFTECNTPDPAGLLAYNDAQDLLRLIVDDGRSGRDVVPVLPDGSLLSPTNTLRSGTQFTGLTAIMDERFTGYRLQLLDAGTETPNARPTTAPDLGGNLTVVGMNVLNYFTTLNSRGADSATELDRQEAKIVAAICELDADVLGLVEIENNGFGPGSATQRLIDAIFASCGIQYVAVEPTETGSDQIKVQLIYKPSVVEPNGDPAFLNTPAELFSRNRVPVAQTFRIVEPGNTGIGGQVTVTVHHWKSKGGSGCGAGDDDDGGAGQCNGSREDMAAATRSWLASDPTGTGVQEQLIIGDLNAYTNETPITSFQDENYELLVQALSGENTFPCGSLPSYQFRGEWGSLDHAIASEALVPFVTGAVPWEVNASEPTALDYNLEDNDPSLFAADFYRFSDHNPIVVGIELEAQLPVELSRFVGAQDKDDVILDWQTRTEVAADRFEVQRQLPDASFATITTVRAVGNTLESQSYQARDDQALFGDNVYRLRMVDVDGTAEFSDLLTVTVDGSPRVEILQTDFNRYQIMDAPVGSVFLVTSALGSVVESGTVIGGAGTAIEGGNLPAGTYFLTVNSPKGENRVFKLIFQ